MDSTGQIYTPEQVQALDKRIEQVTDPKQRLRLEAARNRLIELGDKDLEMLLRMNRKERRAWYREERKRRHKQAVASRAGA